VSPGIAIGSVLILENPSTSVFRVRVAEDRVDREITRLRRALARCKRQILMARERALQEAGEATARVFDAHLLILEDPSLICETSDIIRGERVNAEWAVREIVARYVRVIAGLGDPNLRQRWSDVEDVHARIQQALSGQKRHDLSELEEDVVVVSRDLSPSDLVLLNRRHVRGLAIEEGGRTSHTAIIASALRVPAVVGVGGLAGAARTGDPIVLDGQSGTVRLHPSEGLLREYRDTADRARRREEELLAERDLPAITPDGVAVSLMANLELPDEAATAARFGAQGVGLYRSEFLFLHLAPDLPTEEDHRKTCRAIADRLAPHEVVVRTLDLGGEKYFHRMLEREEIHPGMGLRGLRFSLRRRDIFRVQLRGFLRAAAEGGLSLMFPMVSDLDELRQAKAFLEETRRRLREEGAEVPDRVRLGAMIEVPAAAVVADLLAREVDFFSIGTNDLIQYSLAIDRGNPSVAHLYRPLHPAILRLVQGILDAARSAGIRVALCGEMASDPLCAALLVGMGLTELSLRPAAIPEVKHLIRSLQVSEARRLAREALALPDAGQVERLLLDRLGDRIPPGSTCPVSSTGRV
jgi:phosphotransferase system enzyme I (PtsI)